MQNTLYVTKIKQYPSTTCQPLAKAKVVCILFVFSSIRHCPRYQPPVDPISPANLCFNWARELRQCPISSSWGCIDGFLLLSS